MIVGLSGVMLTLAIAGFDQDSILAYQRPSIMAGQFWRLLTAHFIHLDLIHALLNLAVLPFILYLATQNNMAIQPLFAAIISCPFGISLGLWHFSPDITWYVGFSGVIHGLLLVTLLPGLPQHFLLSTVILVFLALKIYLEQHFHLTHATHYLDHPVIYDAHLYGAITGLIIYGVFSLYQKLRSLPRSPQ